LRLSGKSYKSSRKKRA